MSLGGNRDQTSVERALLRRIGSALKSVGRLFGDSEGDVQNPQADRSPMAVLADRLRAGWKIALIVIIGALLLAVAFRLIRSALRESD